MNNQIALNMTAKEWVGLLATEEAEAATKALHYLDGRQEEEMVCLLNDAHRGRKQWKSRGIIPRFRNITKMIVEKSGLLFNAGVKLEVMRPDAIVEDETATEQLYSLFATTEWEETFINLDHVVRLLKSAMILTQWDNGITFDILHRGNSATVTNGKQIIGLIYKNSAHSYRIFTNTEIIDLVETKANGLEVMEVFPNVYATIPVTFFYDTTIPRSGVWVDGGQDLININELYNIHLTDSEFAMKWMKYGTTVTNATLSSPQSSNEVVESESGPRLATSPKQVAGPDQVVTIESNGANGPVYFEYKTMNVDIAPLNAAVQGWITDYASDWSVRIKMAGEGQASSGFQLAVEEIPNLELRVQRQRMFMSGFKRLFRSIKAITNVASTTTFDENLELYVTFNKPQLPVDIKSQEEVWTMKINEGRATVIDYFIETQGLSKDEALEKHLEIQQFNQPETLVSTQTPQPEIVLTENTTASINN